jgi:regulator of protease activity HflC (stomatin/prohibitin superfamily)
MQSINPWKAVTVTVVCLILFVLLTIGGCAGVKSFNRTQHRADANNAVKVTHILIRKAQQQAQITRAQNAAVAAKAQQRYIEAVGIRRAQDEISKTLTPLYVQHEAIQAQERIASSGKNNTAIYVPSGDAGVPLIRDTSGDHPATTPTK